jgi:hypothetical protein
MTANEYARRLFDDWPGIVYHYPSFELALRHCIQQAVAEEREACAKLAEAWKAGFDPAQMEVWVDGRELADFAVDGSAVDGREVVALIRARGEEKQP